MALPPLTTPRGSAVYWPARPRPGSPSWASRKIRAINNHSNKLSIKKQTFCDGPASRSKLQSKRGSRLGKFSAKPPPKNTISLSSAPAEEMHPAALTKLLRQLNRRCWSHSAPRSEERRVGKEYG